MLSAVAEDAPESLTQELLEALPAEACPLLETFARQLLRELAASPLLYANCPEAPSKPH